MTFPAVGTTELSVPGETPDRIPIEVSEVRSETSVAAATTGDVHLVPWPGGSAPMFAPARLTPSALVSTGAAPDGVMIELGDRLPFSGPDQAMADVGEAVHRFLAADRHDRPPSEREAMAASMLQAWGVDSYVAPVDVVLAADRFWAWLFNRYGENTLLLREWPVQACRADGVEMHGRIDLLVVHRGGLAVIDHKSFPGRDAEERAASYVPQLQAYVEAVEGRGVGLVTEIAVHLPILGRAFVYGCAAGTAGDRC
jgi:hypothetical protein